MSVGAIEPKFYAELLTGLGLAGESLPKQNDRAGWPTLRARFGAAFKAGTQAHWTAIFETTDACVAPVLSFSEARSHAHNAERGTFTRVGEVEQPAPAPRFSRTPAAIFRPPPERGEAGRQALADWGFSDAQVADLRSLGVGCAG